MHEGEKKVYPFVWWNDAIDTKLAFFGPCSFSALTLTDSKTGSCNIVPVFDPVCVSQEACPGSKQLSFSLHQSQVRLQDMDKNSTASTMLHTGDAIFLAVYYNNLKQVIGKVYI